MLTSFKLVCIAALFGLSSAAPTSDAASIVVKNQCGYDLGITKLTSGTSSPETVRVGAGTSKTYTLPSNWQGRLWGRKDCFGDCPMAGATHPASLAEFNFKAHSGMDFYDVSFVDGFNLPMAITPINGNKKQSGDTAYSCGSPVCSSIPSCPKDLQVIENGEVIGCQSACSKYGTDEYCCAGAFNTPQTCSTNIYSKAVKETCPQVYSFAYDDNTSTYVCQATGYNIVFCP
ncbi:thaumatin [Phycomyces nitens]|nr:thaumatin [Phycomyces nitens]